jgi:hypothetical protein
MPRVLCAVLGAVLWVGVACEHPQESRQMTASEHRARAEEYTKQSVSEFDKFDASQTQKDMPGRSPFSVGFDNSFQPYNPTQMHLSNSDQLLRLAAQESEAAKRLEDFENVACAAIPRAQRAACPLLASQVKEVRNTQDGVLLTLRDDANAVDTVRRLQCHLAYARVTGFDHPSCPLFTRGLSIQMQGLHGVAFKGDSVETIRRIQQQAWRVFRGEEQLPVGLR